ncbi:phosphate signaling complex protein PhoU [Nocardioides daphniae]|uniref:Phosphate-specific transport system accessory protein PhoU n=1 Tax=Nocardioides daphniae TaxID=402297 RepID=A0A4P7UB83_9ACTN|nr:phosphate signaling complex protein PhoU [Nocardioides daphniae]QCC76518.1 phosphate signaling complex protein PhoU [Nocardioides daphniae]GGD05907.1 phosphate transport system regulatory protein PhoU [Nocardioides daphniae]
MREAFHDELESVYSDLSAICGQVKVSVERATQALLTGDATLAEQVITADADIDHRRERVEDQAFALLSLQAPVAGDLRMVVAALRMVSELERMGDLSVHIAKIARLRVPEVAVPVDQRSTVVRMAQIAEGMVDKVVRIIADRDTEGPEDLRLQEEEMDKLRRSLFTAMLGDDWPHGVEAAVDLALLGRYYERIADHALSVANRIVFVVTGQAAAVS